MHVAVGDLLISRPFTAISLAVGHGHTEGQILVLNAVQIGQEALMLLSPSVLCHLPGGLINRIERIVGQIALRTTTLAAYQSHCLQFGKQVLAVAVDVQHAVHGLTRGRLLGQH